MKQTLWLVGLIAGMIGSAASAPSDTPRAHVVDPNAVWAMHVNVEGLRESPTWAALTAGDKPALPVLLAQLNHLGKAMGVDPMRDLNGITVFGAAHGSHHVVSVLDADQEAAAKLAARFERCSKHNSTPASLYAHGHEGYVVKDARGCLNYVFILRDEGDESRSSVVMGANEEAVKATLGRLIAATDTTTPSMPPAGGRFDLDVPSGCLLVAMGEDLGTLGREMIASETARRLKHLRLCVREQEGALGATLTLTAPTTEDASALEKVVEGSLAWLASVSCDEKRERVSREEVDKVTTVRRSDSTVTLEVEATPAEAARLVGAALQGIHSIEESRSNHRRRQHGRGSYH